jgi:hypothetical protein
MLEKNTSTLIRITSQHAPEDSIIRLLKQNLETIKSGARARSAGRSAGTSALRLMKQLDERSVKIK